MVERREVVSLVMGALLELWGPGSVPVSEFGAAEGQLGARYLIGGPPADLPVWRLWAGM